MAKIRGGTIVSCDHDTCAAWLSWLAGESQTPPDPSLSDELAWLLAYCESGVVWGRREESGWLVSSSAFPDLCPAVTGQNVLELRLFGANAEVLIWRDEDSATELGADFAGDVPVKLRGRALTDTPAVTKETDEPMDPATEQRIVLGDRVVETNGGFHRVRDAAGAEQAVPALVDETAYRQGYSPLRLRVKEYFEKNSETGAVRVAVSRLVSLEVEAK